MKELGRLNDPPSWCSGKGQFSSSLGSFLIFKEAAYAMRGVLVRFLRGAIQIFELLSLYYNG